MSLACDIVGVSSKPAVWKDEHGWICDQTTFCRKCKAVDIERLAGETTWPEALAAVATSRPVTTREV